MTRLAHEPTMVIGRRPGPVVANPSHLLCASMPLWFLPPAGRLVLAGPKVTNRLEGAG
jgi:hypothetical protein